MQALVNHVAAGRGAFGLLAHVRERHVTLALLACSVAAVAGAAVAALWLGLTLLVRELHRALCARLPEQALGSRTALDLAVDASLAAAPALIWLTRVELSEPLAMLTAFALAAQVFAGGGPVTQVVRRSVALAALFTLFTLDGLARGEPAIAGLCLAFAVFVGAMMAKVARAGELARAQDGEWVRQLNMSFAATQSAAWEIDYQNRRLVGADALGRLLGREVTYVDIVERACFAAPQERAIVQAALSPPAGAARRIAVAHTMCNTDGSHQTVRHEGFLHVAASGAPLRLTCVTEVGFDDAGAESSLQQALAQSERSLLAQARSLAVIDNELGALTRALDLAADVGQAPVALAPRLAHNLTLIEQRRAAISASIDELVRANHAAQSANLAKSQFLAGMSHELRTPLNAIIGYAEMLHEDAEADGRSAATQDLGRILAAARHLLNLINEILDLSKIEAGRLEVACAHFDVRELLIDTVETMRPLSEQNDNRLSLKFGFDALEIDTDATRLRQCVLNLLSNACKFTTGGRIDVRAERRVLNGAPHLYITVADTGIGISAEQMQRLFQPFVQADATITGQYGGTGLGLIITRRLAQLLGGDVEVSSNIGEGSSFILHVPEDYEMARRSSGATADVDAPQGADDAPLVVVIEDEPDARELAARALTRAGFAVQGAGGGEAGLALARARAPTLILLDIFLPDRSGWRVLQSLKHDPKTRDIPVIVLSVNEDRAHALALGAAEHIVKPADRDMLAATVMRLARRRGPHALAAPAKPQPGRKRR